MKTLNVVELTEYELVNVQGGNNEGTKVTNSMLDGKNWLYVDNSPTR
jgi:hypothetical protein